ncbi:hypothetical protein QJS04_geneDACA019020 [Acorus gramineus]|uniref:tRNA/rRNA methyltransferase SpoU type domain-containing protein n=1 Tax=Acorus gramineus TaxID=55184 RepID=A0AAV9BA29_ACOGR|nr:hypothetical protein QJS04_geneDACA019020 [Acorus gramineus]
MDQTGLRILNRTASINLHVRAFSFHGGASSTDSKRDGPSLILNPRFAPRFPRICTSVKTGSNGVAEAANNDARQKHLQVVLVSPQIPGNTGTIARTCAASAVGLHLIEPLGFQVDDAKLKRAGLDYWPYVVVKIHSSWMDFREYFMQQEGDKRLLAFTKRGRTIHSDFSYKRGDWLVFGSETCGLPPEALRDCTCEGIGGGTIQIPMVETYVRCLNLSVSAGIALYEASRQLNYEQILSPPEAEADSDGEKLFATEDIFA